MKTRLRFFLVSGICCSVGLNVLFAFWHFQDRTGEPEEGVQVVALSSSPPDASDGAEVGPPEEAPLEQETEVPFREDLVGFSFLTAGDEGLRQMAAVLAKAGFDGSELRALLRGTVEGEWHEAGAILRLERQGGVPWRSEVFLSPAEASTLLALRRNAEDALAVAIGGERLPRADDPVFASRLDPERALKLARVEEEYRVLLEDARRQMNHLRTEEDTAALRYLEEERRRDLSAFLSRDELADFLLSEDDMKYEEMYSPQLRREYRYFEPSPEELRAMFWIQDDLSNRPGTLNEQAQQRREAVLAMLPPERREKLMEVTGLYSHVRGVADRRGYSREVAEAVFGYMQREAPEIAAVRADASVSPEMREQRVAELRQRNRQTIFNHLGSEGAAIHEALEGGRK